MENLILFLLFILLLCAFGFFQNKENYDGSDYPMIIEHPTNNMLYQNYYNAKRYNASRIVNVP
jgi:hypothetical protein